MKDGGVEGCRLRALVFCALFSALGVVGFCSNDAAAGSSIEERKLLRIITVNVWSGLDYHGVLNFGEYETDSIRELRFDLLVRQLKELDPDVVLMQEANPVGSFSKRLSDSLGYDEVHQVCNAGIKFGPFGPPFNFKEGIAILAKEGLRLERYAVWKLSGGPGIYGDILLLHFDDSEFAQIAKIEVEGKPVFIVNVHLSAFPPADSGVVKELKKWLREGRIDSAEMSNAGTVLAYGSERRQREVKALLENIAELPTGISVIIGGDFNSEMYSTEMASLSATGKFFNAMKNPCTEPAYTWDPVRNGNISFSTRLIDARAVPLDFPGMIAAAYDMKPKMIDYIFVDSSFSPDDVHGARVVLVSPVDGVYTSDHFGVMADIYLPAVPDSVNSRGVTGNRSSIEPLPIVSYDTDIGFGYGAKLFLFDLLKFKEAFDLVVFNSTKGERWYRGVFSLPDLEWREGREYPMAVDVTFDYDKWLKNNFYGIGSESSFSDGEQYTRVPVELSAAFSRGFSREFVGQFVVKYKSIENYGFESTSRLKGLPPALNASTARYSSFGLNIRYDTRNSYVNPSEGLVLEGESEYAPAASFGNLSFVRFAGWFQYYHMLFYPPTVFAIRAGAQQVGGNNLPIQVLTSIGGNNTMRGYTQDRFLDKAGVLVNAEIRFPIVWRLGGVVGIDAGKVWNRLTQADFHRWAVNPVAGLRLYMDNFVVRADLGFGPEGTGFYFNFGQMF